MNLSFLTLAISSFSNIFLETEKCEFLRGIFFPSLLP